MSNQWHLTSPLFLKGKVFLQKVGALVYPFDLNAEYGVKQESNLL